MVVTIFSDAGLCPITGAASWGGWAKSSRGVARAGGIFKSKLFDTTTAEAMAGVNAIHTALANGVLKEGDRVILQTDNQGVRGLLTSATAALAGKHKRKRVKAINAYRGIVEKYRLSVEFRHVKGHSGNKDRRSAVNTWCDDVCTFFLYMARNEINPGRWKKRRPRPVGLE